MSLTFMSGLVESWESSEDGLEYIFTLRQVVSFHDGAPFHVQVVISSADRLAGLDVRS